MIVNQSKISQYFLDYLNGDIEMGLDVGILDLDNAIRFKRGQFVIINGLDNVGKTVWMLWYFLCLSVRHDIKWCIWSGENNAGQLARVLVQFLTGKKLEDMKENEVEIFSAETRISKWFTFIENDQMYTNKDLYSLFLESGCNGCLIDPFTGMDRDYTHAANYSFLNETREFCNTTGITVYVNTHPHSEASRRTYPSNHEWEGYPFPPSKSQSEGGQAFANRPDDFITIHRLVGHPTMTYQTMIFVRKVKDTETGGKVTPIHDPLCFDYNRGLGFTYGGQNPLSKTLVNDLELSNLTSNKSFYDERH